MRSQVGEVRNTTISRKGKGCWIHTKHCWSNGSKLLQRNKSHTLVHSCRFASDCFGCYRSAAAAESFTGLVTGRIQLFFLRSLVHNSGKSHINNTENLISRSYAEIQFHYEQTKMSHDYPCYSSTVLTCFSGAILAGIYALCTETRFTEWQLGWNIRLVASAYMV